jgi:hypothetical protein
VSRSVSWNDEVCDVLVASSITLKFSNNRLGFYLNLLHFRRFMNGRCSISRWRLEIQRQTNHKLMAWRHLNVWSGTDRHDNNQLPTTSKAAENCRVTGHWRVWFNGLTSINAVTNTRQRQSSQVVWETGAWQVSDSRRSKSYRSLTLCWRRHILAWLTYQPTYVHHVSQSNHELVMQQCASQSHSRVWLSNTLYTSASHNSPPVRLQAYVKSVWLAFIQFPFHCMPQREAGAWNGARNKAVYPQASARRRRHCGESWQQAH